MALVGSGKRGGANSHAEKRVEKQPKTPVLE